MIETRLEYNIDLDGGLGMITLSQGFFTGDNEAHTFCVRCSRGHTSVSLTGAGITGYFIRSDGVTIAITGAVENDAAVLTLPAACYAYQGRFSLVIKASKGDVIHTILWVSGSVSKSRTDEVVDPGEVIPTLDELLAKIAEMESATAAANEAAERAEKVGTLTAAATTLPAGSQATAEYDNGALTLGIPKGDTGAMPTVAMSKSGKVTTLTITDGSGPHTSYINDGLDSTLAQTADLQTLTAALNMAWSILYAQTREIETIKEQIAALSAT